RRAGRSIRDRMRKMPNDMPSLPNKSVIFIVDQSGKDNFNELYMGEKAVLLSSYTTFHNLTAAKTKSDVCFLVDVSAEAVGVAIAAPPTDGEANTELIRFLSEVLGLKKSQIALDKVCNLTVNIFCRFTYCNVVIIIFCVFRARGRETK
uniref:Uncharacterized protein n=1 Tax=Neogobius melanostomus TaxID=47308 RepID=A0A8C6WEL0_9GOBI